MQLSDKMQWRLILKQVKETSGVFKSVTEGVFFVLISPQGYFRS